MHDVINRFESAGPQLQAALIGLSAAQLHNRCDPGMWSIHELVVHLADSDAIAIDRMKRVITQDNPTLLSADETAYIERLFPHEQSLDDAVALFTIGRRQMARVLRQLPPETLQRYGTHNVDGKLTLATLISAYSDHFDHHLRFLHGKREQLLASEAFGARP